MTLASMRHKLFRGTAFTANLIIPGVGLALFGHWRLGVSVQLAAWTAVCLVCWCGWIFHPSGCVTLLLLVFSLHLAAAIYGLRCVRQGKGLVNALQTLALCAAAIGFGFVGLKAKPYWLGTKVYFIPSRSMSPTLMVGDFVLTDTWRYNRHSAEPGDIVVFEQPVENRTMIKRVRDVSPAPDLADYLYHVVGDDLKVSLDSRHYGKIRQESLKAEARLVLFSLDPMSKVRRERFLLTL